MPWRVTAPGRRWAIRSRRRRCWPTYGQDRGEPLWLGSMKSNIGHTQAAAGVAGVIKMVQAMRHEVLPATLHVDVPSPHVDWSAGSVSLLTEARAWPADGRARRAGVSSFGISGTNAHVIIEATPPGEPVEGPSSRPSVVPWVVSAKSAVALGAQASRLAEFVGAREQLAAADVGWSLAGRSTFEHRAVVLGNDRGQLLTGLGELAEELPGASMITGQATPAGKSVFVFPGQGSQWLGMGIELLDTAPVFAEQINVCAEAFAEFVDWSLIDVLRGAPGAPGLDRVDVVQPVLFAVMVSLTELWRSIGVRPDAVIGHSQGEIAAAYVAGALSLRDAVRVVTLRSKLLLALSGRGGMASLACGPEQARELLMPYGDRISIAAINGRSAVVVSGEVAALDELVAHCTERELRVRRIDVDYASHSVAVEAIREQLAEALSGIEPRSARTVLLLRGHRWRPGHRRPGRRLLVPQHPPDRRIRSGGARRIRKRLPDFHRIQSASRTDRRHRGHRHRRWCRRHRHTHPWPRGRRPAQVPHFGGAGFRVGCRGGLACGIAGSEVRRVADVCL